MTLRGNIDIEGYKSSESDRMSTRVYLLETKAEENCVMFYARRHATFSQSPIPEKRSRDHRAKLLSNGDDF